MAENERIDDASLPAEEDAAALAAFQPVILPEE